MHEADVKRIYEGRMPCPSCGAELFVCEYGWAFMSEAVANPEIDLVECDRCGEEWQPFDARALVADAQRCSPEARRWLDEYVATMTTLRAKLLAGEVIETALGRFFTATHPAYTGLNPRTGEPVPVPSKRARALVIAGGFASRVLEGASPADGGFESPEATCSIDVTRFEDVLVHELKERGSASLGSIGAFSVGQEDDDPDVVHFRFRRSLQP